MKDHTVKLAYIVSQFPRYDETFIMREMREVAANGPDIAIFSLKPCRDKIIHKDAIPLIQRTFYVPFFISWAFWAGIFYFLFRRPVRLVSTWFVIMSYFWKSPVAFIKNRVVYIKAIGFARIALKENVTHIHGHWATYPAAAAWTIWRLTGIGFSFTGHAHDIYLDTKMLDRKMRDAKFILTCTADNKRYLKTICPDCPDDKITVSYHGLDLRTFAPSVKENDNFLILSVGSLLECKGFDYLLKACKILKDEGRKFNCIIAGGGPLESELRDLIDMLGLNDCVTMTGYIRQDEIVGLYRKAHVLALPAVLEIHWGIPNVLIEALACETPVIITALPSVREVIENNDVGFVIPEKNEAAVADTIRKIADEPALREKMGRLGRAKIEKMFDLERNGKTVADIFMKTADKKNG